MADKTVKIKVVTDEDLSGVKAIDQEIDKIKNQRLQLKIDAKNDEITNIDSQIKSLKMHINSLAKDKIPLEMDLAEIAETQNKIDALEREKIRLKLDIDESELNRTKTSMRELETETKKTSESMGMLSSASSMAVGMVGYDLVNSVIESTRASINARQSMGAFASRLSMSAKDVEEYQASLDEMQQSYKKIDMDVVGQQATDMAYRLGLPKTSLSELTETTAIFTDAMQRNGRSAEDSMLAMSDAMDGQFVRLKEIGIGQDDLMANGWSGDINDKTGLLKAMNAALKDQHYDDLAKSVDTLDDAWQVLSISLGNFLETILVPLTPIITGVVDAITGFFNLLTNNPIAQVIAMLAGFVGGAIALSTVLFTTEGAFVGLSALMPGFITSLWGAASGFMAISVAGAPLWAIVAVIAAIAVAIYEVGKAFGWWSDLGTMFEAISAGAQQMWNAFMNNEGVIMIIEQIKDAFNNLMTFLGEVGGVIAEALGFDTMGGEFDIVSAAINALGQVGNAVLPVISGAIHYFKEACAALAPVVMWVIQNVIIPHFQRIYIVAVTVWPYIAAAVSGAIGVIRGVISGAMAIWSGLQSAWRTLQSVGASVFGALSSIVSSAGSAWNGFKSTVMGAIQPIIDKINDLKNAASGIGNLIGLGGGGIETPIYSGGGYGTSSTTVTQGNTIIFNMYGDVRDEKTIDDMIDAINNRVQFDALSNGTITNTGSGAI